MGIFQRRKSELMEGIDGRITDMKSPEVADIEKGEDKYSREE
jgi:hypothetical protein